MPSRSKSSNQSPKKKSTGQPLFRSAAKRPLSGERLRSALGEDPIRRALAAVTGALPTEMAEHLKKARHHRLLSWRALIDASLAKKP